MLRLRLRLVLYASLMLALSACAGTKTPGADDPRADRSFLTGQPCPATCWYGLELDRSTEADVYKTVKELSFIDQSTIRTGTTPWQEDEEAKILDWRYSYTDKAGGGVRLSHDRLKMVWMAVTYPLDFESVVAKLGPPDYVDFGPYDVRATTCEITLNWPTKNIAVSWGSENNPRQCDAIREGKGVDSQTPAGVIYYMAREGFGSGPPKPEQRLPWPGFSKP